MGNTIEEFRPIHITSPFFKLLEKIIKNRMDNLYRCKLVKEINLNQHGFRKSLGCETNILRLLLDIKELRNNAKNKNNYIVFVDFK